ncbi:MAG: hypothetical protein JXR31_01030, partial [Prolixibacteraceae bacterium]|nr:hypothetical protein [Prolixibacteraceae bacterium]MBN2772799.1 hypothetical protein [Prolixibacteraceae bacterium]
MKRIQEYSIRKIIRLPLLKIIIGGLFCIVIPVLINKPVLDNLFRMLAFSDDLNRLARVSISTLILMPLFYRFLFSKLENRKVTELNLGGSTIAVISGF